MNNVCMILCLADQAEIKEIESVLSGSGLSFQLGVVKNRNDFITALKHIRFDVVIADYELSVFSGKENAFALTQKLVPDLPFIYLAAPVFEDKSLDAFKNGVRDFILKSHLEKIAPVVKKVFNEEKEHRERQRFQFLLEESEERYEKLVQSIPDAVYRLDENGYFLFVSNSIRNMGFEPEDLIGKHFSVLIHDEDAPSVSRENVLPLFYGTETGPDNAPKLFDERRTGERMTRNLRIRLTPEKLLKDSLEPIGNSHIKNVEVFSSGDYLSPSEQNLLRIERNKEKQVWIEITSAREFEQEEKDKKFLGTVGLIRDITEQEKVRRQLEESEEKYRSVIESSSDAICIISYDGTRYLFANPQMYELTGYTVDELNHISPLTLIHPEELPFVEKLLKQIHTGTIEKKPYTIRIITKSGEEKTIHFTFNIISYQGEKSLLLIIRDITKQQKMQQEVEKSHRRYHSLFNNMTDGILYCEVLADEKGNVDNFIVLDANPAYERMTGLKKNKIIGKAITEFSPSTRAADYWKEMYYRAIETAESQKYQFYSTSLGKWIDLSLYSPDEGYVVLIHTDVTERKKNEAELQKLSFAVEQNPASIVITDAAGHIEYVNKKFTELTGYTFTEALGKTPGILNSDAHTQGFYAELWRTILSGKIWEGEIRNKKKNGELYWERAQIAPITDKSGNISHFVAIKEDITEKKAIQQELLLKDNAIANSINAIAFANLEGKITYVNDSFLKLWQFENRDEVLGTTLSRFWISEQSAKLVWDKMLMKGGWIGEVESQKQDGSPLHLAVSASIIYDIETSPIAIMASFMDVTQQKTAQDALKHSEEQLRTIIEKTPIGMCVTDEKGIFEYVNPAYCDFYGYAPSELIGRHFTIVVPEESRNFMSRLHDDFLFHGKEMRGEWEVITHDRKIKHILADAARITARDGKYRKVTFVLDITAIKEKEEETRQLMKKLQISNKELQQFAYAASHDLKEPLRMITGYLELLKRKYQDQLDSDADEFIYFAVDGAKRMKSLIEALLQYSRIQTKGREFKPVDMNRVLKETLQNLKVSIEETKAEINFPDLPLVKGDEIQLVQLLQNLIGNAIKYRKPGIPPEIEISYEKEEGKIRFCVKDNGIGIAPEFQERVFQIFQRLHTHEEYEGIGIGLSICQKIAERHGGKIGVLSAAGEGSAFYFSLPAENKKEKSA